MIRRKRPGVAPDQLGANRDQGRHPPLSSITIVARLVLGREFEDDVFLGGLERKCLAAAIRRDRIAIEEAARNPDHERMRAPVGDVNKETSR
jgi:hypothetical protein